MIQYVRCDVCGLVQVVPEDQPTGHMECAKGCVPQIRVTRELVVDNMLKGVEEVATRMSGYASYDNRAAALIEVKGFLKCAAHEVDALKERLTKLGAVVCWKCHELQVPDPYAASIECKIIKVCSECGARISP